MGGVFITFEGSEGCGKSTQIDLLCAALEGAGRDVLRTREPGGTPLGEEIRELLQHAAAGEGMVSRAELLLFTASRAQLVERVIRPALAGGRIVVSDRFSDSTTVYQGVARRLAAGEVAIVNDFAVAGCRPDLTLYLDMDPEVAMGRVLGRGDGGRDRMEREAAEFFHAVRRGYIELAAREPERIVVIDASRSIDEVAVAVRDAINRRYHGIFEGKGV